VPQKIGSGLSNIQALCIEMRNYIAACVNNHNEITDTEESNHGSNDLAILLTYFLCVVCYLLFVIRALQ